MLVLRMPTVLRRGPYRFHFYSDETGEPPHVHVRYEDKHCKFWLCPVSCAQNCGLPPHRLRAVERVILQQLSFLLRPFDEHRKRQH